MARGDEEKYAIDICDEVLRLTSSRQHRFDFLLGDSRNGRKPRKLPVDAYYRDLHLVIEYCERQHFEEVKFFDKPNSLTVSGVPRSEQRRIYDSRRRSILPQHGIRIVELDYRLLKRDSRGRLLRDRKADAKAIRDLLS